MHEDNSVKLLLDCLADIKVWMDSNFLLLNNNKMEVTVFRRSDLSKTILERFLSFNRSSVRHLGVFFDSSFKFTKQISFISFIQLRLLAKVKLYFLRILKD